MNRSALWRFATAAFTAGGLCFISQVSALPEDRQKPIDVDACSQEMTLDEDIVIHGCDDKPARVTQGTMQITGARIHIDRINGEVQSITAEGNPARFQQQPAADKELVHVNGLRMTLDNATQMVNVEQNVEYTQGDNTMSANHLDYNMETGQANATAAPGGTVQMRLQPGKEQGTATP